VTRDDAPSLGFGLLDSPGSPRSSAAAFGALPVTATAGDRHFWQRAFERHAGFLLAFLGRRLAGHRDAEDLLQETFVRVIRASHSAPDAAPRDEESMRRYLVTVARNLLINRGRHLRVVRRYEVETPTPPEGADTVTTASWEGVADPAASPVTRTSWSLFHRDLEGAVAELPEDQQTAFRLGVLERHSYTEIAERTGWTLAKVKTCVYRSRQGVVARLGDRLPIEGGI
jgi:RNA polymerase sigma-70 factor (ECF subfamily)